MKKRTIDMVQGQDSEEKKIGITDEKILLRWPPLKSGIETIGHRMPDGWWYVYLPFDKDWHFVPDKNVNMVDSERMNGEGDR